MPIKLLFKLLAGAGGIHVALSVRAMCVYVRACVPLYRYPRSSALLMCGDEAHVCLLFFFSSSLLCFRSPLPMNECMALGTNTFLDRLETHWIVSRKCDRENARAICGALARCTLGLSDKVLMSHAVLHACLFLLLVCVKCVHALFVYPASVKCVH